MSGVIMIMPVLDWKCMDVHYKVRHFSAFDLLLIFQAHAGHRSVCAWSLEITSGMILTLYNWLNNSYCFLVPIYGHCHQYKRWAWPK